MAASSKTENKGVVLLLLKCFHVSSELATPQISNLSDPSSEEEEEERKEE